MNKLIAVSWSDYEKHGCVECGCEYCYNQGIQGRGTSPVTCGECGSGFVILADGLKVSAFGFGEPAIYPELQKHPREGTPKHKYVRPDIKPPNGGEYWAPRSIGYDLSGFVKCKEAGERIVKMVEKIIKKEPKTWLDYRKNEPNWIQVKFQKEDGFNLEKLYELCEKDGIITEEKINKALNVQ